MCSSFQAGRPNGNKRHVKEKTIPCMGRDMEYTFALASRCCQFVLTLSIFGKIFLSQFGQFPPTQQISNLDICLLLHI